MYSTGFEQSMPIGHRPHGNHTISHPLHVMMRLDVPVNVTLWTTQQCTQPCPAWFRLALLLLLLEFNRYPPISGSPQRLVVQYNDAACAGEHAIATTAGTTKELDDPIGRC